MRTQLCETRARSSPSAHYFGSCPRAWLSAHRSRPLFAQNEITSRRAAEFDSAGQSLLQGRITACVEDIRAEVSLFCAEYSLHGFSVRGLVFGLVGYGQADE